MFKRIVKIVGMVLGILVATLAIALVYINADGIPRYAAHPPVLTVERTPERIARGKRLSALMCVVCHENGTTHQLTGRRITDLPPAFGEVFSPNITQHPEKGIGSWTDGELAYLLRTGIRRDGQYLPPWMVKLPHLSDEDLASLIAYLRSDDPAVAAADVERVGITKPSLLSKVLAHTVIKPLPYPTQPIVTPPKTDRVAFGRYLAYALDCYSCHSADFKKVDSLFPDRTPGFFGGGNTLVGVEGRPVLSANLTPDEETGIGRWSEAAFVRALRQGFRPDGRALRYPMLPKTELDDQDAGAIYAYLRTVPKIRNLVVQPSDKPDSNASAGKKLFAEYGCTGCHGATGGGSAGVPDLHHVGQHFETDTELRAWLENPLATKPDTKMPAWKNIIADKDYPALLAYVRSLGPAQTALAGGGEPGR